MSDVRLNGPIPAPSEAQLDAGADRDPNANLLDLAGAQPEMSDDQRNTSVDGNAPHTQPEGEFSGSVYPVDANDPIRPDRAGRGRARSRWPRSGGRST
jgi:hypothetical protein